jgi:hypothetical protein
VRAADAFHPLAQADAQHEAEVEPCVDEHSLQYAENIQRSRNPNFTERNFWFWPGCHALDGGNGSEKCRPLLHRQTPCKAQGAQLLRRLPGREALGAQQACT